MLFNREVVFYNSYFVRTDSILKKDFQNNRQGMCNRLRGSTLDNVLHSRKNQGRGLYTFD